MRHLTHHSRTPDQLLRSFIFRHPALPSARTKRLLVIAFGLVAGVALLSNFGSVRNTLRSWLSTSRAVSLDQTLAAQFPALAGSMATQLTAFERTTRRVDGREVAGLTARRSVAEAKGAGSSGNAEGRPAGLKPVEQEALRLMAERNGGAGGEFRAFFPSQYTESFVVEGDGVSAVLRPLEASASEAVIENGHVVYRGAYKETDSLHALGAGRSEEFLYLHTANAPRRFDYELSGIKGATEVRIEGGAVRFKNEAGRGLQIEAPWVVDAVGKRREDVVCWELGEAGENGKRLLSLVVEKGRSCLTRW